MPDGTTAAPPAPTNNGAGALEQATPDQVNEHRSMLSEALQLLQNQLGEKPDQVTQQAGVRNAPVSQLNPAELVQLTRHLAQAHPEILAEVAQRFPLAKDLLPSLVGNSGGANAGQGASGVLNGLLGALGDGH